ncbi:MAG: hypothetical protein ACSW8G_01800 [Bacillota bacterium]
MSKVEFTVLQGGLNSSIPDAKKRFASAYVTNTRLMGVLALYAHWTVEDGGDIHQFFYIDCEEAGLETCTIFRGDWNLEMQMAEQALVGGLGAEKVPLTAKAFRWLLNHWKEFNLRKGLPLPKNEDDYSFIFDKAPKLTKGDETELMEKICGEITSDYQVVNYFLMRCFGQDEPGAAWLAGDRVPLDVFSNYTKATFCKNTIDPSGRPHEYISESLVEMNGKYETIITKMRVKGLKVAKFEYCSKASVTATEAALMLRKTEFATVYELLMEDEDIEDNLGEFVLNMNTVMTTHPNGRLFMAFKPTNDHVAERVFMLSNDVKGVYFLTNFGQLIVVAYDREGILELERGLASSPLRSYLLMTGQYELLDPVLFEFINSDYVDFQAFIDPVE